MSNKFAVVFSLLLAGAGMASAVEGTDVANAAGLVRIVSCPAVALPSKELLADRDGSVPPIPVYPPSAGVHYSGCAYAWNVDYQTPVLFTIARFDDGVLVEAIESSGLDGEPQASHCQWRERSEQLGKTCENARMFWTIMYKSDAQQWRRYRPGAPAQTDK